MPTPSDHNHASFHPISFHITSIRQIYSKWSFILWHWKSGISHLHCHRRFNGLLRSYGGSKIKKVSHHSLRFHKTQSRAGCYWPPWSPPLLLQALNHQRRHTTPSLVPMGRPPHPIPPIPPLNPIESP